MSKLEKQMGSNTMKRTLLAIFIGTLGLALVASAEDQNSAGGNKRRAAVAASRGNTAASVKPSRQQFSARQNATVKPSRQQFNAHQNASVQQNASVHAFRQRGSVNTQANAQTTVTGSNNRAFRNEARQHGFRRAQETTGNAAVAHSTTNEQFARSQHIARQRDLAAVNANRSVTVNRTRNVNRNVTVVNNWRSASFAGRPYNAFRNYHREWHDRGWWRSHHDRLTFVSGGWYFWNGGFWYPAWGYDPGYYYPYDGPIYGYGALTPDQIVANVQSQLRNDGYYDGPIDGILGPQTRYALAAFQADHGLAVTSAVDEPTLATLGLV
jgi:hypothetical protein